MELESITTEFKDVGNYRVTYHAGSNLMEIEEYTYTPKFFGGRKYYWKRIYMGYVSRIETALKLFNESKKQHEKT